MKMGGVFENPDYNFNREEHRAWLLDSCLRFLFTGNCGNHCGYAHPFGFVPEAGCPIHDRDEDDDS